MIEPGQPVAVGDEVIVHLDNYSNIRGHFETLELIAVAEVTETYIELVSGKRYHHDGTEVDDNGWLHTSISAITPEILNAYYRQEAIEKIKKTTWNDVNNDKLKAIVAILEQQGDEQ